MLTLKKRFVTLIVRMEIGLLKLHRWCVRHAKTVLFLGFLGLVLCLTQLSKTKFVLSTEDMAGEGIESVEDLRLTRSIFQDGYISTFFLLPPEHREFFTDEETCIAWQWFSKERLKHPTLQSSFSSFDAQEVKIATPEKLKYGKVFEEEGCPPKEGFAGYRKSFLKLNESPWTLLKGNSKVHPLAFQLTFKPDENTKYGTFDPNVLKDLRSRVALDLPKRIPGVEAHWGGDADYQWYVLEGLNRSKAINLALLVLLSVLLGITFKSAKMGFVFIATLILSGISVYGAKGALSSPFDLLSSSLFIFLGISTLEDFVFVAAAHLSGKSVMSSLRALVVPSFFTSLTTCIGFVSLGVSPVEMVRKFGLWAAYGAALEWLLIFLIFPAFWKTFFGKKRIAPKRKTLQNKVISILMGWKLPRSWALALMIIFPLAVFSSLHLVTQDSPEKIFPPSHPYLSDLKSIQEIHGWKGYVYLVFPDTVSVDAEKKVIREMSGERFQNQIAAIDTLERGVDFIAKGLTESDHELIQRDARRSRSSAMYLGDAAHEGEGWRRAVIYLKDYDVQTISKVQSEVNSLCKADVQIGKPCFLAGNLVAFADFSDKISTTLFDSLFVSLFFVSLLLTILAIRKDQEKTIHWVLLSAFFGPAAMLVVLGCVQLPINFSSCIFLSILVGLTGDNAIQYLYSSRRGNLSIGVEGKAWASVMTTVMMAVSSLVFLGAYFAPPRKLGILLFFGLLISLFGDLWILKAVLKKTKTT